MLNASRSSDKASYCLQQAQAAKAAGNAALQAGNPRRASFEYKRVCLYLAEYLPPDVIESASPAALGHSNSSGSDAGGNSGLVQMLQQQRKQPKSAVAAGVAGNESTASTLTETALLNRQEEITQLYATAINNLALAHIKLSRYREGVKCATAVLEQPRLRAALDAGVQRCTPARFSDTPAGKALLRRATCYIGLSDWALAEADLHTLTTTVHGEATCACGADTLDTAVVQLTNAIQKGRQEEAVKEKKMMQRMFA
ncbi:hypothetical protein JKF63_07220 [Porcisia hertigi]|uniref:Uncharacterized protein n=1 Tax=Porcisia hertigi TaxID=2761500 RepID=A0A836LLD7_9TRYP|nr:hypothetical protein JKF63_07220 [Porcisia hertigi]